MQLGLRRVQVGRRISRAVAADRRHVPTLLALELAHAPAQLDEPLGGGAHLGEGAVSLGGSEDAFGHGAGQS